MSTTATEAITALYPDHLNTVKARTDEALAATGFDSVVIGAGTQISHFLDDQHYPFRPNPHIMQWLPLRQHPDSALLYQPGEMPKLLIYQPDDFWHAPPDLPGAPWAQHFDIVTTGQLDEIDAVLNQLPGSIAYLGDPTQWRHEPPETDENPGNLLTHLNYYRPFRTEYEIECIRRATALAIPAHRAAEQAFRTGASEYDIYLAFLAACRCTENELPYPAIVAKNTHGAVLHYQHYDREPGTSDSLLIDAGCSYNGFASDITRTYGCADSGDAHLFLELVAGLDRVQQKLAAQVAPGKPFAQLHAAAHAAIGGLLQETGIVSADCADPVGAGITRAFFPHGLGHFLGLQVHEVGGSIADTKGTQIERPKQFPHLRLVRTLEPGQILTIEPGLYFIDTLLRDLRAKPAGQAVDWEKLSHLKQFGGIRIEDNILVTDNGNENLTRQAFAP